MQVSTSINISAAKANVWQAITDIENSAVMISSILNIEVLEKPESNFVGFKWKETRKIFGKEATEVMWITDAIENDFYATRAESHGSVYISKLSLMDLDGDTKLTMSFSGEATTFMSKILSTLMGPFIKGTMVKELNKDLLDIKQFVEQS